MIQPVELYQVLHGKPFRPFRVRVADGRVYEVRYPELNVIGKDYFAIGIPVADDPDPVADHVDVVPLDMIQQVEHLGDEAVAHVSR
jgi:hypothetical protein